MSKTVKTDDQSGKGARSALAAMASELLAAQDAQAVAKSAAAIKKAVKQSDKGAEKDLNASLAKFSGAGSSIVEPPVAKPVTAKSLVKSMVKDATASAVDSPAGLSTTPAAKAPNSFFKSLTPTNVLASDAVKSVNRLAGLLDGRDLSMPQIRAIIAKSQQAYLECEYVYQQDLNTKIGKTLEDAGIWAEMALYEIQAFAAANAGRIVLTETVREAVEAKIGPAVTDSRVWGGLIRRAAKRGFVEKTEAFGWTCRSNYNASPKSCWLVLEVSAPKRKTKQQIDEQNEFLRRQARSAVLKSYFSAQRVASPA
jgi:hypothetical protein